MIITDIHTHTKFSSDGKDEMEDIILTAIERGVSYYGIAEHLDYDYELFKVKIHGKTMPLLNLHAYFEKGREMQEKYKDKIHLLIGLEVGFANDKRLFDMVNLVISRFKPDFIVNSTHTVGNQDCYFPEFCEGKTKELAYGMYLEKICESLDAGYPFDIISHIGYISRNAPYEDKKLRYCEFKDVIDRILLKIIEKGKILEVNSSSRGAGSDFLPDTDIIERYYQLGGRKVSFASDTHDCARVAEGREKVVSVLRKIGFEYLTIPDEDETKIEI